MCNFRKYIARLLVLAFILSPFNGITVYADENSNETAEEIIVESIEEGTSFIEDDISDNNTPEEESSNPNGEIQTIDHEANSEEVVDESVIDNEARTRKKNEIIIKFKQVKSETEVKNNLESSLKSARAFSSLDSLEVEEKIDEFKIAIISIADDENIEVVIEAIKKDSTVEYAQPNYSFEILDEVQEAEVPETGTSETEIPETETPETETQETEIPETEAPETEIPEVQIPEIETPETSLQEQELPAPASPTDLINENNQDKQWALKNNGQVINGKQGTQGIDINLYPAYEKGYSFSEVIVGVLDTGIDTDHVGLAGKTVAGYDFVNMDETVFDEGDVAHGTRVAGIIAADGAGVSHDELATDTDAAFTKGVEGVAANAKIMPLKFFQDGYGYTSDAIAAIEFAKEKGVKIINCSWGSDIYNPILKDVMKQNSDILFVCAAGNNGDSKNIYPAAFDLPNVISVASIDNTGSLALTSNYGSTVDTAAPGLDIYTTEPDNQFGFASGTSMAAAHVTGAAALYRGKNGEAACYEVKDAIIYSAGKIDGLVDKIRSQGIIDIDSMLMYAAAEFPNGERDIEDFIEPPQELMDLLASDPMYTSLNEEQKKLLSDYMYLREDTMTACAEESYSLMDSIKKALIMQKLNISFHEAMLMIENHGSEDRALDMAMEYNTLQHTYSFLNDSNKEELLQLIIDGYETKNVVYADIAANALGLSLRDIVVKGENNIDFIDFSSFTKDETLILKDVLQIYYVKPEIILNYLLENSLLPSELHSIIAVYQTEINMFIRHKNELLDGEVIKSIRGKEEASAPFSYMGETNENISLNNGSLLYEDTIAGIPGRGGLGLDLTIQYDSGRANVDKMYGKVIETTYSRVEYREYYIYVDVYAEGLHMVFDRYRLSNGSYIYYGRMQERFGLFDSRNAATSYGNSLLGRTVYSNGNLYRDTYTGFNIYPELWASQVPVLVGEPYLNTWTETSYQNEVKRNQIGDNPFEYMGAGWAFNFSHVTIDDQTSGKSVRLPNGSTYSYQKNVTYSNLKNYKRKDIKFEEDLNGQYPGSKYILSYASGNKEYFDGKGNLIGIKDKFNNTIDLKQNRTGTYSGEIVITDTSNLITRIKYSSSNITVSLPDGTSVVYLLEKRGDYTYLTKKTDQEGRVTAYNYTAQSALFDFFSDSGYGNGNAYSNYNNMTSITHPTGGVTKYSYSKADGNLGAKGRYQYYRIATREDVDGSTSYNKQTYSYSGNNYTGYPNKYDPGNLASGFTYNTTVTDAGNVSKIYYFNYKHLNTGLDINNGGGKKFSDRYEYNSNDQPTAANHSVYGTGGTHDTGELFEYDEYGNMTGYWNKEAGKNRNDTEHKTTYTYNTTPYNMLTSKSYKKDSSTTINEDYMLSSDNKTITGAKVYENGTLKGQTDFDYDSYGNVISKKEYVDSEKSITTTFAYKNGIFLENESRAGTTISLTYDPLGRILSSTDGNGCKTSFGYDRLGRQTKVTNPDGSVMTNSFDNANNTLTTTNENGLKIKRSYNRLGNLISIQDITGSAVTLSSYSYDDLGRMIKETNANNSTTYYIYDYLDRLRSKYIDPVVSDGNNGNNGNNGMIIINENNGNVGVNGLPNLKITGYAYEETYVYEDVYDSTYSKVTKEIKGDENAPSIKTATYTHKNGYIDKQSRWIDNIEIFDTFRYDYLYNKTYVLAADTKATAYTYDHGGRITSTTNADGSVYKTSYDFLGRKISATDPKGNTISYSYDDLGNLIKEETPFENGARTEKTYQYDKNGNVTSERITNNKPNEATTEKITDYEYNNRNFVVKVSAFDKGAIENYTEYKYDKVGNKTEMLTANGTQKTTYQYDAQNRLTRLTDPLLQSESYTYDNMGNLITKTDRNGNKTENTYDTLNRLTYVRVTNPSNETAIEYMSYAYGKTGAKVKEKNENLTTTFVYDSTGRVIKQTELNDQMSAFSNVTPITPITPVPPKVKAPTNNSVTPVPTKVKTSTDDPLKDLGLTYVTPALTVVKTYTYDTLDNLKSFVLTQNDTTRTNETYDYDNMSRLIRTYDFGATVVSYTYDRNGNRESMMYPNGVSTSYEYNQANLVTKLTNKNNDRVLSSYSYTYKLDGNQATKTESTGTATTYIYDDLGRLTKETETTPTITTTKAYTFDKASNRKTMTVTKTGDGTYTTTYSYDLNNRLLTEEKQSVLTKEVTEYQYDQNGNQISKTNHGILDQPNGASQQNIFSMSGNVTMSKKQLQSEPEAELNRFDSFNRLSSTENEKGIAYYTYKADGLRLSKSINGVKTAHVWNGANIVLELNGNNEVISKYNRGIGLVKNQDGNYYVFNAHGDVVQMVDRSGAVVKNYRYDAFGVEENIDANDLNPWRYCGEYFDLSSGTYYLRNRNYNPAIGRFLTEDPIKDGLNWYTYANNNPIMYIDPSGLLSFILYDDTDKKGFVVGQPEYWTNKIKETHGNSEMVINIPISSAFDFDKFWENISDTLVEYNINSITEMVIICHGSPRNIEFNGELVSRDHIRSLQLFTINTLTLSSCNTGHLDWLDDASLHPDHYDGLGNIASAFIESGMIGAVNAFDGTLMNFVPHATFSTVMSPNQAFYKKDAIKVDIVFGKVYRDPVGWVIYSLDSKGDIVVKYK